jgi:hypothetical protein
VNQQVTTTPTHIFPPQLWTELSGAALILSEILWVSLFYQAITRSEKNLVLVVLVLAMVGMLSHYLSRLSSGRPDRAKTRNIISGVWILLCLAVSARLLYTSAEIPGLWQSFWHLGSDLFTYEQRTPASAHMIIIVLLILRGVRLARTPVTIGFNQTSFRLSAAAFLLFGTVYFSYLEPSSFIAFGLYLFLALCGMTFGRIAYLGQTRGGKLPPYGWSWFGNISLAILTIVTGAVSAGFLISGKIANYLATVVVSLLGALAVAAAYILTPILQVVIGFIMRMLERTPGSDLVVGPEAREGFNQAEEVAGNEAVLTNIVELLQSLLPVVILIIVVVLIVSSLGWRPWSRKPQAIEEEVVAIKPTINPKQKGTKGIFSRLMNPGRLLAAARIRRIYAQLMDLSAQLGERRPPATTPLEFLPKLAALFPAEKESVGIITHAYLNVRYGEAPEESKAVQDVVSAWKKVNQQGRQLLIKQKAAVRSRPRE